MAKFCELWIFRTVLNTTQRRSIFEKSVTVQKSCKVVQRKMPRCSDVFDFLSSEINIRNNFKINVFLRPPWVFVLVSLLRIQRQYNTALCLTERPLTGARCINHPMVTSALPDRTSDTTGPVSVKSRRFLCTTPLETFCQVMIRCWEIPSLTSDTFIYSLNPQTFCFGGLSDNITYFSICLDPKITRNDLLMQLDFIHRPPRAILSGLLPQSWQINYFYWHQHRLLTVTNEFKKNKLQQNITTNTISFLSPSDIRLFSQTQSVRCIFTSTHDGVSHCGFTPTPAAFSWVWSLTAASVCTVAPCSCTCTDLGSWMGREDSFLVLIYVI